MSNKSRFQFPGFVFKAAADTSTHEVEIGTIEDGGNVFLLHLIRNNQYRDLDFLVAKVIDVKTGDEVWHFKSESFSGAGVLAKAEDNVVIALVGRGKEGKVERVIPLSSVSSGSRPDLRLGVRLKKAAATFLRRKYILSPMEEKILKIDTNREAEAEEIRRATAAVAREAARRIKVNAILSREQVTGYTADGRRRYGFPVVGEDWKSLPDETFVVLVDSIDEETGKVGNLIEAFQVIKEPGRNPKKGYSLPVTATTPVARQTTSSVPQSHRSVLAEVKGGAYEVFLFMSMDDIRAARTAGLNGGTLVAVDQMDSAGKIEVMEIHADRVETIGKILPLE